MRSQPQATKAKAAKIEGMARIREAFLTARAKGQVKTRKVKLSPA